MKCPYCGHADQKVLDSRPAREDRAIRRRRECQRCDRRFTTFEEPEKYRLMVVKRSGAREEFSREKVLGGLLMACRKRPVSHEMLQSAVESIEMELFDRMEPEVTSNRIGELVMGRLRLIDAVAYVRFASVYQECATVADFQDLMQHASQVHPQPALFEESAPSVS